MFEEIDIWFGGGYEKDYRLPFINLKCSDIDDPDIRCLKPIKGHIVVLKPEGKAHIQITDSEWLELMDKAEPFYIIAPRIPQDGFVGPEEYAWSYKEKRNVPTHKRNSLLNRLRCRQICKTHD